MYNLQWLKLESKIFSNRKIQILLKETDGDTYFRVWIQMLTISMECNNDGKLVIRENKPMTIQDFSKIMGKSKKKIEKIVKRFLDLDMLIKENEIFIIKNWNKYQSIEKYEKYLLQNRQRQQKYREKVKSENEKSMNEYNGKVTLYNTEEEIKNKELEKRREESENGFRKYQN